MSSTGPRAPLIEIGLDPRLEAVAEARHALETVPEPADPERRGDLALLVTELVVNSVRHARVRQAGGIRLRVEHRPPYLRVEVSDPGTGFEPRVAEPPPGAPGGRGLLLVDRMARRWGVRHDDRTRVWFDLEWRRRPPRAGRPGRAARRDEPQANGVVTGPSRSRSRS